MSEGQQVQLPKALRVITLVALGRMHADLNVSPGDRAQAIEAMAILEDADVTAVKHADAAPYVPGQYSGRPDNQVSPPGELNVYRVALLFAAIADTDSDLAEAMYEIVGDSPTAPRIVAQWLREPGA